MRHEAGLEADLGLPHLPLELDAGRQRRDRVDCDHVDGAGADEEVDDLERLLAVVGLGDEQLVGVDADPLRVDRVDRVLGVDERADAAARLCLGEDVVDQGGLPRRLRAEDLDDPPARDAAHAEREVEGERPGGDRVDLDRAVVAELHHGALAELLLDLGHRRLEGGLARLRLLRVGGAQRRWGFLVSHLLHHSFSVPVRSGDGKSVLARGT